MPRPRAYRSNKDVDADGPNWSYSQLVIGIAVTIVLAVTIFSIGYVVAIYDRPLSTSSQVTANNTQAPNASPTKTEAPAPTAASGKAPDSKASKITPPGTPKTTVKRPNQTPIEITPLPAPGAEPTHMVKTPVTLPKKPSEDSQKITPPSTPSTPPKTTNQTTTDTPSTNKKPAPAPGTTPTTKPAAPDTAPKVEAPKPKKPPAPSAVKGSWGIQVAMFDGKDRQKQATTFKQRMKSGINQDAIVVVSKDDKEYRVFIDGFSTEGKARAACEKLKSKTGFAGAWVKRLP
jgi:cell division protein FtsN